MRQRTGTLDNRTLLLLLILATALALRLRGIEFGLPDLLHPDEPFEMHRALRLGTGAFDFRRTGKGGLYFLLFLQMAVAAVALLVTGRIPDLAAFGPWFVRHEELFYLGGRLTSAILGTVTVYLVYRLGLRVRDRTTGLIAAAALALAPTHIAESHFAVVDPLLVLLMTATWLLLLRSAPPPGRSGLAGAGVLLGLSLCTKLPAVVLVLPAAAVVLRARTPGWSRRALTLFVPFLVVTATVEPGYVVNGPRLVSKMLAARQAPESAESTAAQSAGRDPIAFPWEAENLPTFYAGALEENLGLPLLAFAVAGTLALLAHRPRTALLFWLFLLAYFLAISWTPTRLHFYRYVLPMLPLLSVLGGTGVSATAARMAKGASTRARRAVWLIALLALAPLVPRALATARSFSFDGSRTQAMLWVESHLPAGSVVLMEGSPEHRSHFLVPLRPSPEDLDRVIQSLAPRDPGKAWYLRLYRERVLNQEAPAYHLRFVRQEDPWPDLATVRRTGVKYVVLQRRKFTAGGEKSSGPALASRARFRWELDQAGGGAPLAAFGCGQGETGRGPCLGLYQVVPPAEPAGSEKPLNGAAPPR